MDRRAFVPDLNRVPAFNITYDLTRFEHDPRHDLRRAGRAALRYLHPVNKDKKFLALMVKLANGFVFAHGSISWVHRDAQLTH
jgi:hypothetical protein